MRTSIRRNHAIAAMLVTTLALLTVVGPVSAATPQRVTIVSHVTFNPNGPNYGDFTATGANGLICGSGTFVDTGIKFAGYQSNRQVQITVFKEFTCPDGTFAMKLQIHANSDGTESFTWIIQTGSGPYSTLKGSGVGSTVPNADRSTGNTNTYTGILLH